MTTERRSRGHIRRRNASIDEAVGRHIREVRITRGMSQIELADRIGVSHQQVYKYERGINFLCVGMLVRVAAALGTSASDILRAVRAEAAADRQPVEDRGGVDHLRAFQALPPTVQLASTRFLRALAGPVAGAAE